MFCKSISVVRGDGEKDVRCKKKKKKYNNTKLPSVKKEAKM